MRVNKNNRLTRKDKEKRRIKKQFSKISRFFEKDGRKFVMLAEYDNGEAINTYSDMNFLANAVIAMAKNCYMSMVDKGNKDMAEKFMYMLKGIDIDCGEEVNNG